MKDRILSEIRRVTELQGGKVPGRQAFERESGIRESTWRGIYWARWGDAVEEAGLSPNQLQGKLNADVVLEKLCQACRHFGHVPTSAELRMYGRTDPDFPAHSTISNHFTKAAMLERLAEWTGQRNDLADVAAMVAQTASAEPKAEAAPAKADGWVYLARSGQHYKIGRASDVERRMKQIQPALPEALTPEHFIRTDDPPGIEAYWHRRFGNRRANGEWFKLTRADVAAFKRRKYQ